MNDVLDHARDPLDERLRVLVHTAVTNRLAAPPTVADIAAGPASGTASDIGARFDEGSRSPRRRWIAIAAALVLIAMCVSWLAMRRDGDSRPVGPDGGSGLDVHLLPSVLPDGWRFVDAVERGPIPDPRDQRVLVVAERDGAGRAVITDMPLTDGAARPSSSVADAEWTDAASTSRGTSSLSWYSSATTTYTQIVVDGLDEATTRTLAASLVVSNSTTPASYSLPAGSPFVVEHEYVTGSAPIASTQLQYSVGSKTSVTAHLLRGSAVPDVALLLHPDQPSDQPVITGSSADGAFSAVQALGDIAVYVDVTVSDGSGTGDPSLVADVTTFLRALAPVSPTAWVDAVETSRAQLAELPVTETIETSLGTLTVREDALRSGLCLQPTGVVVPVCRGMAPNDAPSGGGVVPNGVFDILVDGDWYVVVFGKTTQPQGSVHPVDGTVRRAEAVVAGITFTVLAAPPGATRITYTLSTGARIDAARPVR